MSEPRKQRIIAAVVAALAAALDDQAEAVFQRVGDYWPNVQSLSPSQKPAAFVVELNERPLKSRDTGEGLYTMQDGELWSLPFAVILVGSETKAELLAAELRRLEAYVDATLKRNSLSGLVFPIFKIGCDTPEANMTLPLGTKMPAYRAEYLLQDADPYDPS